MDPRPSGWYDDPDEPDRLRYWDGGSWTERTHFKAPMPAPQPPKPPVARLRPPREDRGEDASDPVRGSGSREGRDGRRDARSDAPEGRDARDDRARENRPSSSPFDSPRPWSTDGRVRTDRPARDGGPGARGDLTTAPPAPYWRRALAYLLDLLVVGAAFLVFLFAVTPFLTEVLTQQQAWLDGVWAAYRQKQPMPEVPAAVLQVSTILSLIFAGMLVLYDTVLHSRFGATVGGLALGIRVCDENGDRAPVGRLLWRAVVKYSGWLLGSRPETALVGYAFNLVDFLWPVSSRRHRTLHDLWSSTRVVRA